jgi:hypothetical protein
MLPIRASSVSTDHTDEPSLQPAFTVGAIAFAARTPVPSPASGDRSAALLEYFANPSPKMCATDVAWDEALALYGNEDSDAWVAALKDGTHPLCGLGALTHLT